jgi:hypothetical protein
MFSFKQKEPEGDK